MTTESKPEHAEKPIGMMSATELEAHIASKEKRHKTEMNSLRALLRALQAQQK